MNNGQHDNQQLENTTQGMQRMNPLIPPWAEIDTVLLDMDGTLLDLHFDTHFWLEHVPLRYAEANKLSPEMAREQLMKRYRQAEGKLEWYCVDFWSEQRGLDIEFLKQEVDHLISVRPDVIRFLQLALFLLSLAFFGLIGEVADFTGLQCLGQLVSSQS